MLTVRIFGLFLLLFFLCPSQLHAIVDPLAVGNNKVGVHIISPVPQEASSAATLANSNGGDWGYIAIVIEAKDKNVGKWQAFFDELRRRHLIPLVRIATVPKGDYWGRPEESEAAQWAQFLNQLNWPTKNRYVIVYNEPNHAKEWGNQIDPKGYANILKRTIDELKKYSKDFFVLNAGFDASAPQKLPDYADEAWFLEQMQEEVPGIFNELDGWVSHSYPNPNFAGSPHDTGRGTVRSYLWEKELVRSAFRVKKDLPVFITETGWAHAEGVSIDQTRPRVGTVASYFQQAFEGAWSDPTIVAVTPFVLSYQGQPFDHFSFKKLEGKTNTNVLGTQAPPYYPQYYTLANLPKQTGVPEQTSHAELTFGRVHTALVIDETYSTLLEFRNTGQSIWGEREPVRLTVESVPAGIAAQAPLVSSHPVEPGSTGKFEVRIRPSVVGTFQLTLRLLNGLAPFDQEPIAYTVTVKPPVMLKAFAQLRFKGDHAGTYMVDVSDRQGNLYPKIPVKLNRDGHGNLEEARYLLPDVEYLFTMARPFYMRKTISVTTRSGITALDFGILDPDWMQAVLHPKKLWELLPFTT